MSLSFPTGPTNGQQVTTGGRTYQWSGQAWTLVGLTLLVSVVFYRLVAKIRRRSS
jgi:hypothetical protein